MVDDYRRQGALAHLHLAAQETTEPGTAGVWLCARRFRGQINLRIDPRDSARVAAAEAALGVALPRAPNTSAHGADRTVLWLGPDEWLVVLAADEDESAVADALAAALTEHHAAIVAVGHARTVIGVAGPRARDVLAKGCGLDLHPRAFGPGQCAQTALARAGIILHQRDGFHQREGGPSYDIDCRRSFAPYVWAWLEDAAGEYGVAVIADDPPVPGA